MIIGSEPIVDPVLRAEQDRRAAWELSNAATRGKCSRCGLALRTPHVWGLCDACQRDTQAALEQAILPADPPRPQSRWWF